MSAIHRVELSTDVKGCNTSARCERGGKIYFLMETLRGLRDKPAQRGSVIQKHCFNQRILNHSSSIQHDPQTVRKAGRTEIRLNEVVNWLLALNESDGARAISKRLSDA